VGDALEKLSGNEAQFCTTSYDPTISATEKRFWKAAGIDPASASQYSTNKLPEDQALQKANKEGAYVFTSRSTYITLKQSGAIPNMTVYVEGENNLVMPYTVLVNPNELGTSAHRMANRFAEWLGKETAQSLFGGYGRVWEQDVPLYTPAVRKEVATEDMLIDKDL
jgi:tungstate transport system substrate-binding protein